MGFTKIFHRQSETKLRRVKYIWEYYLPKCIAIKCSTICYSPPWYLEVWLRLLRLMRGNLGWIVSRWSPWALLSNMTLWNESEGKKIFCGALWLVIEKKKGWDTVSSLSSVRGQWSAYQVELFLFHFDVLNEFHYMLHNWKNPASSEEKKITNTRVS